MQATAQRPLSPKAPVYGSQRKEIVPPPTRGPVIVETDRARQPTPPRPVHLGFDVSLYLIEMKILVK